MATINLPGQYANFVDGNLRFPNLSNAEVVMVLGTAETGPADTPVLVGPDGLAAAKSLFGTDGTLIRGMYEVAGTVAGADGVVIKLFRFGATSATLDNVGDNDATSEPPGLRITTVSAGATAGADLALAFDKAVPQIQIYDVSGATPRKIYDRTGNDVPTLDTGEVFVTGILADTVDITQANLGAIDTPGSLVSFATAATTLGYNATLTAGTSGTGLSRMETWEKLHQSYLLLENEDIDVVVPMAVYLDDLNTQDLTDTEISNKGLTLDLAQTYPSAGANNDALGLVFIQEYQGEWLYWWDTDRDDTAELYPTAGGSSATTDAYGDAIPSGAFHEVNFAYQLANFCFVSTENNVAMNGVVGVKGAKSRALRDVINWIGTEPVVAFNSLGQGIITDNGTGLLGNKFMAGRLDAGVGGPPGLSIDGVDGLADGGFIATDSGYLDGTQLKDENEALVDIGKYISVVAAYQSFNTSFSPSTYISNSAPAYAGFYSQLDPQSAPTNKLPPGATLPFRVSNAKLDALAGKRYVMYAQKTKGIVVVDAPTAARPESDYNRLTTFRIVDAVIDEMRLVADPYIGEPNTALRRAALETELSSRLDELVQAGLLQRKSIQILSSPQQQVLGEATVRLELVPAFELRKLTYISSLAAL